MIFGRGLVSVDLAGGIRDHQAQQSTQNAEKSYGARIAITHPRSQVAQNKKIVLRKYVKKRFPGGIYFWSNILEDY